MARRPPRDHEVRNLRVLHVIPSLSPHRGGPSFMLRSLADELCRQGVDVVVASTDDDGMGRYPETKALLSGQELANYEIHPRTLRFYSLSLSLGTWLRRNVAAFDLVHVHALFSYPSTQACFWARRRGVPYLVRPLGVLNHWGLENRRPWLKQLSLTCLERPLLERCQAIHCTSEAEATQIRLAGIRAATFVIPNPVSISQVALARVRGSWRARLEGVAQRKWLLFLSRVDPKKGLEVTFQGLAKIPAGSRPLLLLAGSGDPEYIEQLKALQDQLGLGRDVSWLGFVEGTEKLALLADADAFILNSYSENFGIAAAEAMAAGLPVIVSDQVGLACDVRTYATGIVTEISPAAVAEAIPLVLMNPGEWGKNGMDYVRKHCSVESVAAEIIAVYRGRAPRGQVRLEAPNG